MKRIMIVDDNPLSVEGIEKNIDWAAMGTQVIHVAYSGLSAMEAFQREPADIIISDIEMPDLDGISMSRQALALNPMVKVILISAYDRFDYARRAIRIGVCDYIEKPIDYGYLAKKIESACEMIDQEQKNLALLNASRPAMTEKFFQDLIHCQPKEASYHLASHMDYLGLKLDYRFFAVVIFDMENAAELQNQIGVESYEMLLFKLQDMILQNFRIFDFCYLLKHFDHLELVIGQNGSHISHFSQSIHKAVSAVSDQFQSTETSLSIGIGNICQDLWSLSLSHQSALHALEYRFFFPQQNVFDTREMLGRNLSLEPFSDAREDELIRLICQKDDDAIRQWILDFSSQLLNQYQAKDFIFVRIYTLLGRILKFLCELNLETADLEEKISQTYARLESFNTGEQFFSWLYEICLLACQKLDSSLKTYHDQLCGSVLSYIRENYESSNLCLHDIARYVNVSPAYLSALFKKVMKVSISDTISKTRIDAACQYLETSSLSLKEISEKCGYANQYYFSTAFKKINGCSPSVYRSAHQPHI